MPLAPWSPRPRMRSPSVTTMMPAWSGQLARTSAIRPRSLMLMNMPRGRWKMCPKRWQARPDRRRVDERLDFVDVVAHDAEEQRFVAVVQRVQRDEFLERIGKLAQVVEHARGLLVLRVHVRREQPAQAERIAFVLGERGALVAQRVVQQADAAQGGSPAVLHGVPPSSIAFPFSGNAGGPGLTWIRRGQITPVYRVHRGQTAGPAPRAAPEPRRAACGPRGAGRDGCAIPRRR